MEKREIDLSKVVCKLLEGQTLFDISNNLRCDMSNLESKTMKYLLAHDDASKLLCKLLPYANRRQLTDLFYAKRIIENTQNRSNFCRIEHITEAKYDWIFSTICPLISDSVKIFQKKEKCDKNLPKSFCRTHCLFRVIY